MKTSSSSQTSAKVNPCIELLFSKFAAFYGHVWRSQFKDERFFQFAKKEWEKALMSFGAETIERATRFFRDTTEMPPTLPQVVIKCKDIKKRQAEDEKMKQAREKKQPPIPLPWKSLIKTIIQPTGEITC